MLQYPCQEDKQPMRTFRWLVFATILSLIVSPLGFVHSAPENTFTTTSVLDTVDAAPGDGECADSNGACTLRAAVMEANASIGPDTILLSEDIYYLTISGDSEDNAVTGDLDILGNVTITGAGPEVTIIDAISLNDRIFHILRNADVAISGVTIRNANITNGNGGGIFNQGILSITNSILRDNKTSHSGGGIYNSGGELSIKDSTVHSNNARYDAGGIFNNTGILYVTNSVIKGNRSYDYGGGIYVTDGETTITDSTITDNISVNAGGGIYATSFFAFAEITIIGSTISNNQSNFGQGGGIASFANLTITTSTISGNQAGTDGGGISIYGVMKLINSTISGNQADGLGGGIYNNSYWLEARNATIVNNTANSDGDGTGTYGGGIANDGGSDSAVRLFNTILALNIHAKKSGEIFYAEDDDCIGIMDQLSYSLLTTTTGCTYTSDHSITGENPKLEALAYHGGTTQTHALKADSPAIDAGNPNGCMDAEGNLLNTDQRGEPRSFDGNSDGTPVCDIGAYEYLIYQALTVDKAGTGDGLITSSPAGIDCGQDCSADLPQGSVVALTAEPSEGSSFMGWSGDCSGSGNCQITLDAAKTVTATFEVDQMLTVIKAGTGAGRVISLPAGIDCGPDCTATFAHGSLVTLTADPDEGSSFTGWSGACFGNDECQINTESEKSVTATFDVITDPTLKLFLPMSLR